MLRNATWFMLRGRNSAAGHLSVRLQATICLDWAEHRQIPNPGFWRANTEANTDRHYVAANVQTANVDRHQRKECRLKMQSFLTIGAFIQSNEVIDPATCRHHAAARLRSWT